MKESEKGRQVPSELIVRAAQPPTSPKAEVGGEITPSASAVSPARVPSGPPAGTRPSQKAKEPDFGPAVKAGLKVAGEILKNPVVEGVLAVAILQWLGAVELSPVTAPMVTGLTTSGIVFAREFWKHRNDEFDNVIFPIALKTVGWGLVGVAARAGIDWSLQNGVNEARQMLGMAPVEPVTQVVPDLAPVRTSPVDSWSLSELWPVAAGGGAGLAYLLYRRAGGPHPLGAPPGIGRPDSKK